jgi:hypothetical protein
VNRASEAIEENLVYPALKEIEENEENQAYQA